MAGLASSKLATDTQEPEWQQYWQRGAPASDAANCFVGQVFPLCGGWVTR